jgi:hypothetical protein
MIEKIFDLIFKKFFEKIDSSEAYIITGTLVFGFMALTNLLGTIRSAIQGVLSEDIRLILVSFVELPFKIPFGWYFIAIIFSCAFLFEAVAKWFEFNGKWCREDYWSKLFSLILVLVTKYWMIYFVVKLLFDKKIPSLSITDQIHKYTGISWISVLTKIPLEALNPIVFWINVIVWLYCLIYRMGQIKSEN